ncbi:MAG: hypothetical protein WDM87_01740 [Terracidiphilus sp.]
MVDFGGWDMPVEYPGAAAASSPSTWPCAPASASLTLATWARFSFAAPALSPPSSTSP